MTEQRPPADAIEFPFAKFMSRLADTRDEALVSLFRDVSRSLTSQHSCIDLRDYDEGDDLRARLKALPIVGSRDDHTPLILDGDLVFLARYFHYEVRIAERLAAMNRALDDAPADAAALVTRHFPTPGRQRLAAWQALTRQLVIIAGGPGTGKTTTVAGMLQALLDTGSAARIALAAPTGKAAMRLEASLSGAGKGFEVKTLHRLLGMRPDGSGFRYGPDRPLPVDLLIVDEMSMVDLAMMHRLLAALPGEARLVLLGDPGQLPSVEAGNILADLCKYGFPYSPAFADRAGTNIGVMLPGEPPRHRLQDAMCLLIESHRFSNDRGIGRLARAIREDPDVTVRSDDEVTRRSIETLTPDELAGFYEEYLDAMSGSGVDAMIEAFDRVRILTPLREGPFGVREINRMVEDALQSRGLIPSRRSGPEEAFYHGRPVLVTRNDYNLRLFNGDIGLCVIEDGEPVVVFGGWPEPRTCLASRLPPVETCFAMTVHKSQGSEFDRVVLALPAPSTDTQAGLMSREMIYTAVTRARREIVIAAADDVVARALARRNERRSGLGERLVIAPPSVADTEQLALF